MSTTMTTTDLTAFVAFARAQAETAHRCRERGHQLTVEVRNVGRCLNVMRCECGQEERTVDSSD